MAIVTALTLRMVFHLPFRQTEGFVASLISLMGLALHPTIRRSHDVIVVCRFRTWAEVTKARFISSSTQAA